MLSGEDIPDPCESAELVRMLAGVAAEHGADAHRLAREAGLPDWVLASGGAMVPTRLAVRMFELTASTLDLPDLGLILPRMHTVGDLGLYDYLFATAATLGDAMQVGGEFIHLISTNDRISVEESTATETTFAFRIAEGDGRGGELLSQLGVAMLTTRARAGTSRPVAPVRVSFPFAAPQRYRPVAEAIGTSRVDFGCPVTSVTFSTRDLRLPMTRSDPQLARILAGFASTLPVPEPTTWLGQFRLKLDEMLAAGSPSIDRAASGLSVSTRTLQRRLTEYETTWRAELDSARQRRTDRSGARSTHQLAASLGYADPRSVRRARRRWKAVQTETAGPEHERGHRG